MDHVIANAKGDNLTTHGGSRHEAASSVGNTATLLSEYQHPFLPSPASRQIDEAQRSRDVRPPAVYCTSFTCPDCYEYVQHFERIECEDDACDYTQCCAQIVYCDSHSCPDFYKHIPSPEEAKCEFGVCVDDKCCEHDRPPAVYCNSFTCPDCYVPLSYDIECEDGVCDYSQCCKHVPPAPHCDSYTCSESYKLLSNAKNIKCDNGGCDDKQCCKHHHSALHCDSYECSKPYYLLPNAKHIKCDNGVCGREQCCEHAPHCDSYNKCSKPYYLVPNAKDIKCAQGGCDDKQCCEHAPHCDSYNKCSKPYYLVPYAKDIKCAKGGCDDKQCCEYAPHCDTYKCPNACAPLPKAKEIRCHGDGCDDEQCCEHGACNPNPCYNGGTCERDVGGGHVCSCPSGYGGMACQTDTKSLARFFITFEFAGGWTDHQKKTFQKAADRWAKVITHVPCGGNDEFPPGQLLIIAVLEDIQNKKGIKGGNQPDEAGIKGGALPLKVWEQCQTISLAGLIHMKIGDIQTVQVSDFFEAILMNLIGHVIGVGTLWGDCSTCQDDKDPTWKCPAAVSAYNDLLGDPDGNEDRIIEIERNNAMSCRSFDEYLFHDELMVGVLQWPSYLSKITAASLDDTGYIVDPSQVDGYTLPALRHGASANAELGVHLAEEKAVDITVKIMDEDGDIVGKLDAVKIEFDSHKEDNNE